VELYFHTSNTPSWRGGAQGQLYLYKPVLHSH
jgi:hypothetical protein